MAKIAQSTKSKSKFKMGNFKVMKKWINVEDRKPKDNEIVLCVTDSPDGSYPKYIISTYCHYAERFCNINGYVVTYRDDGAKKITHWMTIPEPPLKNT